MMIPKIDLEGQIAVATAGRVVTVRSYNAGKLQDAYRLNPGMAMSLAVQLVEMAREAVDNATKYDEANSRGAAERDRTVVPLFPARLERTGQNCDDCDYYTVTGGAPGYLLGRVVVGPGVGELGSALVWGIPEGTIRDEEPVAVTPRTRFIPRSDRFREGGR